MSKVYHQIFGRPVVYNQAMMEVTTDPAAKRLMIVDRLSGEKIWNTPTSPSRLLRLIVPLRFGTSNELLVGIMDDDRVNNAKFVDGVKAQIVDGNTVRMAR
ncbi:hypothetical protein [Shewanella sp. Isolate7]|uniref:hypothetical protein n=1 Tax=Shewanella sp. Isolate7 TaxID=2908528 RepID=UPI001EFE641D|nr:hypothetical protein [Shewanella sp. Isolate7]MCG9720643.1 hypothetical protein [Shewanella sp. Isolate7]